MMGIIGDQVAAREESIEGAGEIAKAANLVHGASVSAHRLPNQSIHPSIHLISKKKYNDQSKSVRIAI